MPRPWRRCRATSPVPKRIVVKSLARLLPRTFRDRVFEPAWADLVLAERGDHSARGPGTVAQLTLLATCWRILLVGIVWQQITWRRPLRVARNAVLLLVVTAYVILRARYGHPAAH